MGLASECNLKIVPAFYNTQFDLAEPLKLIPGTIKEQHWPEDLAGAILLCYHLYSKHQYYGGLHFGIIYSSIYKVCLSCATQRSYY